MRITQAAASWQHVRPIGEDIVAGEMQMCIRDRCKAIDKRMELGEIRLESKSGGKSGDFVR